MYQVGKIDHDVLEDITELCCPTVGSCQHMATANSMLHGRGSGLKPAGFPRQFRLSITTVSARHFSLARRLFIWY